MSERAISTCHGHTQARMDKIECPYCEVGRLRAAILGIDAHATPIAEDEDGFVTGGYVISVGSLHRARGLVGHTAPLCSACDVSGRRVYGGDGRTE